jgi:predicted RNA-binding protein (virulence factor B family)
MIKTATAINTFLPEQKDSFELPQEQQLITLSIADYKNIFIYNEKLNDRIATLESQIRVLDSTS